jgi:hypothetical protein
MIDVVWAHGPCRHSPSPVVVSCIVTPCFPVICHPPCADQPLLALGCWVPDAFVVVILPLVTISTHFPPLPRAVAQWQGWVLGNFVIIPCSLSSPVPCPLSSPVPCLLSSLVPVLPPPIVVLLLLPLLPRRRIPMVCC